MVWSFNLNGNQAGNRYVYETNFVKPAVIPILTEGWCKEPLTTFKALPTTIPPVLFILNYYCATKVGSVVYLSKTIIVNS